MMMWAGTLQDLFILQTCLSNAEAWSSCPLMVFATAMLYCNTAWALPKLVGNHSKITSIMLCKYKKKF